MTQAVTQAVEIVETESVLPSPTIEPTPTQSQPGILFLHSPGMDSEIGAQLESLLAAQAQQAGLTFQSIESLEAPQIGSNIKGILVYGVDPGMDAVVQAYPDTPILAVNVPGIQPAGNIQVLALDENGSDQAGFLAGYLASVITPDWRVGIISTADTPTGKAASLGFSNGVVFYCGLCRPAYPPFLAYPVIVDLSSVPGEAEIQAAVDSMVNTSVSVVYVPRQVSSDFLYQKLSEAGILVIGSGAPPPGLESQWVASIEPDLLAAIEQVGLTWLDGDVQLPIAVPIRFTRANSDLFSPGRQNLVSVLQQELQDGYIDTGVDPSTGDPRP